MNKIISIEHCHNCNQNMRIELDADLDGNHVIECPNCGHEHCRVIENGKVTRDRWDSRNQNVYYYTATTCSCSTNYTTTGNAAIYSLWLDTTGT